MQWSLPADVVDTDKLQQRRVDEAHAHAVPHVHRRQVRHHRKRAAETVGGGEKIQHGRDAYHDASRHGIPLQPEGNEGRGHQYDARNEHRGKVERPVTGKHEVYFQATVITSPAGFNGAGNGLVLDQVRIQSRQRRALPESVLVVLPDIPYR